MVRWQDVAMGLSGGVGLIALFGALFLLTGIDYTYTSDSVCNELTCIAHINVTTTYWRICFEHPEDTQTAYLPGVYSLEKTTIGEAPDTVLYKKSTYGRTLWVNLNNVKNIIDTEPNIPVEWLVPTYGSKWRSLKDGDCWDRLKTNRIKLVGHPSKGQLIKWNFNIEDKVNIDPVWGSWNVIYKNISKKVTTLEDVLYEVPANPKNNSKAYNYTVRKGVTRTVFYPGEKIGLNVIGVEYNKNTHVNKDTLVKWNFPISDRNLNEYGNCREYEKAKGYCTETNLLQAMII